MQTIVSGEVKNALNLIFVQVVYEIKQDDEVFVLKHLNHREKVNSFESISILQQLSFKGRLFCCNSQCLLFK